jgi:hypothetical protein
MASMDTNSLINCISSLLISSISLASHHFLFHQYHLHLMHLITSYFINITYILCISSLLISLPLCHQWTKRLFITNVDPREFYDKCWMALEIFESYLHGINFLHFQLIQESFIHVQHTLQWSLIFQRWLIIMLIWSDTYDI